MNAVVGKRPSLRRMMQQSWDLAFAWLRQEPPTHHVALPWQALLSMISASLSWGWTKVAGVLALSWGGITRIGEVMQEEFDPPFGSGGNDLLCAPGNTRAKDAVSDCQTSSGEG